MKKDAKNNYEIKDGIGDLIGNTPIIRIKSLSNETGCDILAKVEFMNIGGSPKDRVALKIVEDAEKELLITPHSGCTLFEGTVGSTGISLATIAKSKGYNCHIVMPDDVAIEKYELLIKLGATVERVRPCSIVDPNHFVNIAKTRAHQMNLEADKNNSNARGLFCNQFENPSNFKAHYETTGPEIFFQTRGNIDAIVMGSGTGGTLAGVAHYLKPKINHLSVCLADPEGSGLYNKIKYG